MKHMVALTYIVFDISDVISARLDLDADCIHIKTEKEEFDINYPNNDINLESDFDDLCDAIIKRYQDGDREDC